MAEFHESKIVAMIGIPNGVLRQFQTPSAFLSGTIRVIWNGTVYDPSDDERGWIELADNLIEFSTRAPVTGDVLTCFYQELNPIPGIGNVRGSPFHPVDAYP